MLVHGVDTDNRHDQGGAGAACRADGAEQIGPSEPPVAPDARARAALGPDAGQRALLANAGFILKPDFDRPAGKLLRDCGARQLSEVFLKLLCLKVALRVHRTHRHAAEIQLLQQLADAALVQMNIEFGGNAVTQVSTAPAHHAIGLEVRAVFHPLRHFAPLGFGQTRLTPRPGPVRQPAKPSAFVAMHQSRSVCRSMALALRGQQPRMTIQHHGNGQNAPRLLGVSRPRRLRRNCEILRSWRSISIADMLPAPRINDVLHRVTFAAGWESPRSQVLGRLV